MVKPREQVEIAVSNLQTVALLQPAVTSLSKSKRDGEMEMAKAVGCVVDLLRRLRDALAKKRRENQRLTARWAELRRRVAESTVRLSGGSMDMVSGGKQMAAHVLSIMDELEDD